MSIEDGPQVSEASFLILFALAWGPSHGYGIRRRLRGLTGREFDVPSATLYTRLERMAEHGYVAEIEVKRRDSRRGRVYAMTSMGRHMLRMEVRRMRLIMELITRLGVDKWLAKKRGAGRPGAESSPPPDILASHDIPFAFDRITELS